VKLDLTAVLGGIISATSRIGVGATYSTTYYDPFHGRARSPPWTTCPAGRAAWNVVTSVNDSEARNFGLDRHLGTTSATTGGGVPPGGDRAVGLLGGRRAGAGPSFR